MERTEHFRGKLMAGDEVVLEAVEGHLKSRMSPGSRNAEWTGSVHLAPELKGKLNNGARYRLVLHDGRSGHVYVRVEEADPLGRCVANFHGAGSPRR